MNTALYFGFFVCLMSLLVAGILILIEGMYEESTQEKKEDEGEEDIRGKV